MIIDYDNKFDLQYNFDNMISHGINLCIQIIYNIKVLNLLFQLYFSLKIIARIS